MSYCSYPTALPYLCIYLYLPVRLSPSVCLRARISLSLPFTHSNYQCPSPYNFLHFFSQTYILFPLTFWNSFRNYYFVPRYITELSSPHMYMNICNQLWPFVWERPFQSIDYLLYIFPPFSIQTRNNDQLLSCTSLNCIPHCLIDLHFILNVVLRIKLIYMSHNLHPLVWLRQPRRLNSTFPISS